jgi:hypothetical protein
VHALTQGRNWELPKTIGECAVSSSIDADEGISHRQASFNIYHAAERLTCDSTPCGTPGDHGTGWCDGWIADLNATGTEAGRRENAKPRRTHVDMSNHRNAGLVNSLASCLAPRSAAGTGTDAERPPRSVRFNHAEAVPRRPDPWSPVGCNADVRRGGQSPEACRSVNATRCKAAEERW